MFMDALEDDANAKGLDSIEFFAYIKELETDEDVDALNKAHVEKGCTEPNFDHLACECCEFAFMCELCR